MSAIFAFGCFKEHMNTGTENMQDFPLNRKNPSMSSTYDFIVSYSVRMALEAEQENILSNFLTITNYSFLVQYNWFA